VRGNVHRRRSQGQRSGSHARAGDGTKQAKSELVEFLRSDALKLIVANVVGVGSAYHRVLRIFQNKRGLARAKERLQRALNPSQQVSENDRMERVAHAPAGDQPALDLLVACDCAGDVVSNATTSTQGTEEQQMISSASPEANADGIALPAWFDVALSSIAHHHLKACAGASLTLAGVDVYTLLYMAEFMPCEGRESIELQVNDPTGTELFQATMCGMIFFLSRMRDSLNTTSVRVVLRVPRGEAEQSALVRFGVHPQPLELPQVVLTVSSFATLWQSDLASLFAE
jgi:hypothetical protein